MTAIPAKLVEALAGRYTIEKEIGAGGMATVYLAEDVKHRRRVAIKVFRPELSESLGPERFLREIEVAAALTHPHILPLHDSGAAEGILYYVMPFIEGESLRDRLAREGALPVVDAVRIFRDVVDALGEAHRKGVVHRDVKPANVLLTGGHALVADFGVARAVRESADQKSLTVTGIAIGTPQYMAPEQAAAESTADHRADLFAAGIVAYEMLTGISPFAAKSTAATFAALMTKTPEPPRVVREAVPEALGNLVMACLEKDPERRPQSAAEVLAELDAVLTPTGVTAAAPLGKVPARRRSTLAMTAAGLVVLVAGSFVILRGIQERARERWAREDAIPEVMRLADGGRLTDAAALAEEAARVVGADPLLETAWPRISTPFRVTSEPSGATVSYRPYDAADAEWRPLGTTPYTTQRFPVGVFRFRVELDGREAVEVARSLISAVQLTEFQNVGFDYLTDPSYVVDVRFGSDDDMVVVAGGPYGLLPIAGYGTIAPMDIPEFSIDRTEVTNAAYQEFVAAGGYADSSAWVEPFERDGGLVGWAEAMRSFRDATDRPGPATWTVGTPPPGQEDHPVGGVSWFEASAYCRWRGKALPTLFHWARAALPSSDVWQPFNPHLAAASNFEGVGLRPVGSGSAIGVSGAYDLAGNVREWVSTPSGPDRYLMGGSWSDPQYALFDQIAASPWVRLPTDGLRCASYSGGGPTDALEVGIEYPVQVFGRQAAMSDEVFEAMRRPFSYAHDQPLRATTDSTRTLESGVTVEWVSVDTPYGQRLPIRLHIPVNAEPPYQAMVFFPGGNVIRSRQLPAPILDFLVRSGRVLVDPVFDGTWQRNDGRTLQRLSNSGSSVELFAHWVQDIGRVLDYLEQRPDMDGSRVGYVGLSFGAGVSTTILPYEPRFRVAVLYSGGFSLREPQESIDRRSSLVARVRIPLLMLGGRHDFAQTARLQEELFKVFGSPAEHKRQVIYENAGHWPLPMNEVIRETVDWLDRYLGPVTPRP